ncbi:MAG: MATE family efflux transporter [bacterium]
MNITEKIKSAKGKGDPTKKIIFYWLPELISTGILISVPPVLDSLIISHLKSTTIFGAFGMAASLLHTLTKLSESIPVAEMAIVGRHNGAQEYPKCGQDLGDTFWTTIFIGISQFLLIFFGASTIYSWLGVSDKMISIGTPYLILRSLGIFLVFVLMSFIGFMRGVKNTKIPMLINIVGMATFSFFDYSLVLGRFGFPQIGLTGSAIASIIQYVVMISIAVSYIHLNPDYKKYFYKLFFNYFNNKRVAQLLNLSWPIMIDKGSLAFAYIWLSKMIAPMGKYAIATYDIINKLERFAILPAAGFANVVIFLVSNRLGANDPDGAKANVKKIMVMTAGSVLVTLSILCYNSRFFVSFFDPKHKFTDFASTALTFISLFVVFDFVQLILAGALRGSGSVRSVMWVRFFSCFFFFLPLSYFLAHLPIESEVLKFIIIYGTFYINTGFMGLLFLKKIMSPNWKKDIT